MPVRPLPGTHRQSGTVDDSEATMHRRWTTAAALATALCAGCGFGGSSGGPAAPTVGDGPVLASHVDQAHLDSGADAVEHCIAEGRALFVASFNAFDGAGRPERTGTGAARARRTGLDAFNRVSGPDANSCAGCHNLPAVGAGGDNVANVFVLGQRFPFVDFAQPPGEGDGFETHTLREAANERNTLGMYGAGYVELLAREMTRDLAAVRAAAVAAAAQSGTDETRALVAKGVSFGALTAHANGTLDTSAVEGVDADLVVRPFHQKGVVVSLRVFTNNAMLHHHGMSSVERAGAGVDDDGDGVVDELSVGDVTAATIFQATLPPPGRRMPTSAQGRADVAAGEALFGAIGCATCHVPSLRLDDPVFSEPSPFNPPGNLRPADVASPIRFDLTTTGPAPHLARGPGGAVVVPLYSDLKRHDMGPGLDNEQLVQGGVPTRMWLTKKLWGFSSEPPFLHHGRATTVAEAILAHGGEGQASRDAFAALGSDDRRKVVAFLRTLQILPEGTPTLELPADEEDAVGDAPVVRSHVDLAAVEAGAVPTAALLAAGERLFVASFNTLDGAGRPGSTGTGAPRAPRTAPENFNRISGPDANACSGCHNLPVAGGGGDQVANVFVLAQRLPFVDFTSPPGAGDGSAAQTLRGVGNERNTLGMFGSGYIELLAREMTEDLRAVRAEAVSTAAASGFDVTRALVAKGVSFGTITAHADGSLDASGVEGVDADLIVRPFHQKGVVVSLREFTANAVNHHHGMQASERVGLGVDADGDGVVDELTAGDLTALSLWQATLQVPTSSWPTDPVAWHAAYRGKTMFERIGCATCHVPALRLRSPLFSEPGPWNPPGTLRAADVAVPVTVDLTTTGPGPRLPREDDGSVLVPAFTDLKRHDMGPALDNETLVQAGVPTRLWLTKKLWGFSSEPPFLHHGRATTITEAILAHGGEGQAARDAFAAAGPRAQEDLVEFLKTLQVR